MSKIKEWWKESKKIEVLELVDHIRLKAEDRLYRKDAQAFYDYFVRNGYFTEYMKIRIREMARLSGISDKKKKKSDPKRGEHYLYAISNGEHIKVGYSKSPKARLKQLQTGQARPLKLVWQCLCGYSDQEAKAQERKLHRRLQSNRVSGEWFEFDCLLICRSWRIFHLDKAKERYLKYANEEVIEQELDLQMLEQIHRLDVI